MGHGGLTEPELEYLVRLRDRGVAFFTEERVQGRWCCRFAGYAGAIAMPSGRTLEVLPKVGDLDDLATRRLLMRMLAAAEVAPALQDATADYADSPNLIEAYLRFAADLAVQQVRQGLVHAYRRQDQRLPMVRGRLLVARQLAQLPERFDAHLVRTDDFVADTPVNRAIKAGAQWMAKVTTVTSTSSKCREVVIRMDAVTDTVGHPSALAEMVRRLAAGAGRDRRQARLVPLLRVLGLLLDGLGAAPEAGVEAPGPTLMFDMSKLFETLLASRLRQVLPDCSVDEQTLHRFGQDGRFLLQPDLVVSRGAKRVLVIDAKWKRIARHADVADADLRQAFAYARILGVTQAALVYPQQDATVLPLRRVFVADGSAVVIHLSMVPMSASDWSRLDDEMAKLCGEAVF